MFAFLLVKAKTAGKIFSQIKQKKNAPFGAFFNGVIRENLESKFC